MSSFLYFAYGSNILESRLLPRCPSANVEGLAVAKGYTVEFSKSSNDGSGKASLIAISEQLWWGRLFRIQTNELPLLDSAEGAGYGYERHENFSVWLSGSDEPTIATTYLADHRKPELVPYDWYLALVLAGHWEASLPDEQVQTIRNTSYSVHGVLEHKERKKAISALQTSGFDSINQVLDKT